MANQPLEQLREGDTFVAWKLDRLGRSVNSVRFIDMVSIFYTPYDKGVVPSYNEFLDDIKRELTNYE
nr:hypothetical protein [Candidatus Paracaedibacter symbiosus]